MDFLVQNLLHLKLFLVFRVEILSLLKLQKEKKLECTKGKSPSESQEILISLQVKKPFKAFLTTFVEKYIQWTDISMHFLNNKVTASSTLNSIVYCKGSS